MVLEDGPKWSNPDLRIKLGEAARKVALKTFAVESHVQNVQNIYKLYGKLTTDETTK